MEKIKISGTRKILKIFKWIFLILIGLFIILVICRAFYRVSEDKTNAQVIKIHDTKLTMDDVLGKNLPPDPGALADQTVQGVDANNNGIRDDVELAIFNAYPNSAKTRAVLLQYALEMQMEFIQPIINKETVTEVVTEQSRADTCVADTLVPRKNPESDRTSADMEKIDTFINFVEDKQINNNIRAEAQKNFLKNHLGSFGDSTNNICDIDISKLLN
jgi:hypothetical protein